MPKATTAPEKGATSATAVERSSAKVATHRRTTFRLTGEFRKGSHGFILYPKKRIDNEDIINYVDENGRILQRRIRLLMGVNTIWEDEQDVDEGIATRLKPDISFTDGTFVAPDDMTAEFLRQKNCCATNPNRIPGKKPWYYEIKPELSEEELYDQEVLRQKARSMAMDASSEDMWYHADYLNINPWSDDGERVSDKGMKARYVKFASDKPDIFMKTAGASDLKYSYIVKRLVQENKIKINIPALEASWNTGTHISTLPERQDPVKYLARFALSEEGKDFKTRLDNMDITKL